MASLLIESYYNLENKEDILKFLDQYPKIKVFLEKNISNFNNIVNCPISLKLNTTKFCNCMDEEDNLLWIFAESKGHFNSYLIEQIEDYIFDHIISPAWFDTDGMIGFSVR
jgi:hypothetical protein